MFALPAMPTQPASAAVGHRCCTLWAIWIWLSSLTPSPITRIVQRAAVDRRIGADFHIVADDDATDLRNLDPALALLGKTETIATDDRT